MAFTRPKASQINFDVTNISDTLIRLNSGQTGSADKDVGLVIERGDDTNTAFLYDESADQFVLVNTTEDGTTSGNVTIASYAGLQANAIVYGSLNDGTTTLTSTVAELNLLDGVTGITLGNANELLVVGSDGTSIITDSVLTIDADSNYIGINQTSPEVTLHMTGDGAQSAQIRMEQHNDSADAPDVRTRRSRGTAASPSNLNAGDYLFRINAEAYQSGTYATLGSIQLDTSSSDVSKGVIQFQTHDGSSLATRLQILDSGAIRFNSAYTFPTSDGSANQILTTNGSGVLSFASPASSSFTLAADSGSNDTFTTGGTLTFEGGTGVDTTVSNDQISIAIDSTVTTLSGTQTLTNKTLTSPTINDPTFGGVLALTSTSTTVSPLTLTANSLQDNVGSLRINSSEPDIFLNQAASGFTTVTFARTISSVVQPMVGFGKNSSDNLYMFRETAQDAANTTVYDNTSFVLTRSTGNISMAHDLAVTGEVSYGTLNDGTTTLTSTVAELNILDGVTATTAELNILDGVTATAAELNILDGVTSTATELNLLDGITGVTLDNAGDLLIVGSDGTSIDSSALLNIDTGNGRLGIGTSSPARTLHLVGDTQFEGSMRIDQYHTSSDGPDILFQKARGTPASTTAAANGDELIKIVGLVHDGTDFQTRVRILSDTVLDGSDYGANIQFQTGDGAAPTTRFTIAEDGNITVADGAFDFDIAAHDGTNGLKLGGTLVTSSAAELNHVSGVTSSIQTQIDNISSSFTIAADSGSNDTFTTGETLTFTGGEGVSTTVTDNTITIATTGANPDIELDSAVGDNSTTDFSVTTAPTAAEDLLVTINGIVQRPTTDYTVSGTTVTFGTAPFTGAVVAARTITAASTGPEVSADTSPQLGGDLDVNGNKIVSVSDGDIDIEPNGTGDVLLGNFRFDADQSVGSGQDNYVFTYDNSSGKISLEEAAGGGITWNEATGNTTMSAGNGYFVDTSSTAITMTLPASPSLGDEISIIDGAGNAATNNITVGRNSELIQGDAEDMVVDVSEAAFTLVYYNSTYGWRLRNK